MNNKILRTRNLLEAINLCPDDWFKVRVMFGVMTSTDSINESLRNGGSIFYGHGGITAIENGYSTTKDKMNDYLLLWKVTEKFNRAYKEKTGKTILNLVEKKEQVYIIFLCQK